MEKNLKICFFPGRESSYARTRVLLKAMKEVGIEVYDCSCPQRGRIRYLIGFTKFLKYKGKCDLILVGFLGHFLMPFVKLFTRKKILFDAFLSVHLTMVVDRKRFKEGSLLEKLANFIDEFPCNLADKVFLDTFEHIEYITKGKNLDKSKFSRLFLGSDDSVMYPREVESTGNFVVEFHGEFQALHGVTYILEAAKLLQETQFCLLGKGVLLENCKELAQKHNLNNVTFVPRIPYKEVPIHIANGSVSLGIFGDTLKTKIVIPHKVYEALAMKRAIITANTPAARELLTHKETAFLCNPADAQSLSDAIRELRDNPDLRQRIANNGHNLFLEKCSPKQIGEEILKTAREVIK